MSNSLFPRGGQPVGDRQPATVIVASPTEARNPRTTQIDQLSALEVLQLLNDEDASVAGAVRRVLPALAELVEDAVERIDRGGRVHYFGAGTSGRLGLLDAVELPPTFGVRDGLFEAHLAGGDAAIRRAQEGGEDDYHQGTVDCADVSPTDVVIGIAASGYTQYVGGALARASQIGSHTVLITSNPGAPLRSLARTVICVETGAEAITGSTRLKSATAQKLVLNAFSTSVMVRAGRTYSNLMVDLTPTNAKLRGRILKLLMQATGESQETCEAALSQSSQEPKTALVVLLAGVDPDSARAALADTGGRVAQALTSLTDD